MEKFVDDVIEHKEDDIEKIQTKPNMYISYSGRRGSKQLAYENINNGIDECINPNSPGDEIDIVIDETENSISVTDNGRGIQFEKMELVCTKLQAGSKFTREGSGGSAGENGVGMTAMNALSDWFEIISYRYGERAKVRFELGKLVQPLTVKKVSGDKHGTTVAFRPSSMFLGEDCAIDSDELLAWTEKIICLVPPEIKVNFNVIKKGKESTIQKKFRNKNGLYDYCKKLAKKPLIDPIHFMRTMKMMERVNTITPSNLDDAMKSPNSTFKDVERFIGLEVAFTFNSGSVDMVADSFCNFINTVENGVHVDAVKTGILQYLTKQTKDMMSEKEAKNIDITFGDAAQGLVLTVYLSTNMQPQFASQTKEKLTNNDFFKPLRDMSYRALDEYFKKNTKELKKLTDMIKTNAKARIEANKVRNSVIKGETTSLDEHKLKNFAPANNKGRNEYRELFLIEGDSAMGSARQGRFDNDTQALFALKGVPLNSFSLKLDKVLLNDEFRGLTKVLGCNIGERFDITKLKYKKIIIMTDADIDGNRITSLICAFFLVHMPEIVKQGYLYKAVTPLYKIKDNKKPFILNKQEYIEVFEERVRKNIRLINPETKVVFKEKDMKEFLLNNREYLEELDRVANHFAVHPMIVEFLAIHMDDSDFLKKLRKKFPELKVDEDNVLSGIYEGRYQNIILDKIFNKRVNTLKTLIREVNQNKAYYILHEVRGKEFEDRGLMSIGELLTLCEKFQPEIEMRYKGLGELDPAKLRETTLDPNNRILIKLTLEDLEAELTKFRILHGDDSEERKKLMAHFKINREDLDN